MVEAFAQPALALLHRQWAPFVVTVFETAFAGDETAVLQPQLRRHLEAVMHELSMHGVGVPDRSPVELCAQWVRDGWLISAPHDDQEEVYELTAASLDALRIVAELARPQTMNSSRVQQILVLVEQAAQLATGDRDTRIAYLQREVAALQTELDRLLGGGEVEVGTYSEMADRYDQISRELGSLPADFRRVRELIETARKEMAARVMSGEGPVGEALLDALTKATGVLEETPEGRAFTGVRDLLQRDATHLRDLRRHAQLILDHEFAEALDAAERREFADVGAVFNSNIEMVMGATRSLSTSVQDVTARHTRGGSPRELTDAIRAARTALLGHHGDRVAGVARLIRADITSVTRGLYDPDTAPRPRALDDFPGSTAVPMSRDELARWGGPHMLRLAEHIDVVLAVEEGPVPLSRIWRESAEDLRRAVELSGYLTLAVRHEAARFHRTATETVRTTRPDGTGLDWEIPLVEFARRRNV